LFDKIIKPFLSDQSVLDYVLKGKTIKNSKGNVVEGNTGAKIYPELMHYLRMVENVKIQEYLSGEFNNYTLYHD